MGKKTTKPPTENTTAMDSSSFLLLQQNDFLSNYAGSFQELRKTQELCDATLACGDQTIEAHKVVLASCSPFFRKTFSTIKQAHLFIYLKGVLHKVLVALLDYIYTGETQVAVEDLDRFIEVAHDIRIKGLAEEMLTKEPEKSDAFYNVLSKTETIIELDEEYNDQDGSSVIDSFVEHFNLLGKGLKIEGNDDKKLIKCEKVSQPNPNIPDKVLSDKKVLSDEDENGESVEKSVKTMTKSRKRFTSEAEKEQHEKLRSEIFARIEMYQDSDEGSMWRCTECGKLLKRKDKLENHIESHLKGFTHNCSYCDKTRSTRGALRTHISLNHKDEKDNVLNKSI